MIKSVVLVDISDLNRVLYNALLFCTKNSSTKGTIQIYVSLDAVEFMATDDVVIFHELLESNLDPNEVLQAGPVFYLQKVDAAELEKFSRNEFGEFYIALDGDTLSIGPFVFHTDQSQNERVWDKIALIREQARVTDCYKGGFAIDPSRFRKFSLIRTAQEYPMDIIHGCYSDTDEVLIFKIGPYIHGLVSPLNRAHLRTMYDSNSLW